MRLFLFLLFCVNLVIDCTAFAQPTSERIVKCNGYRGTEIFPLLLPASLTSALRLSNNGDDDKVNVNLIDDVDSFTLTAVGFGLIAFNFFVLANVRGRISRFLSFRIASLTTISWLTFHAVDGRCRSRWNCCPHNEHLWVNRMFRKYLIGVDSNLVNKAELLLPNHE
jgi:hypothetical protein